tara:strand:+ start:460 stop:1377 length:918 start_codon:yes stop_codon:yes gene_type:complete
MVHRGIETTDKLILNGFLGHFFRFSFFSILNLLIIPLLVIDIISFKKKEQWQKAFLFLYVSILSLISIKGFFNPRYSLTLYPISCIYIIISTYTLIERKSYKHFKTLVPILMVIIVGGLFSKKIYIQINKNTFFKDFLFSQTYNSDKNGPLIAAKNSEKPICKSVYEAIVENNYPQYRFNPKFYNPYPKYSEIDIFNKINELSKTDSKLILNNNLPAIYYYTNANSVYYWSGDDLVFNGNGRFPLFKNRTNQEVKLFLTDSLNVGYIYTYEPYNKYYPNFSSFLKEECKLIEQNYNTYQLFKITP